MSKPERYLIMRERACLLSPVYWNGLVQSSSESKKLYGRKCSYLWIKFFQKENEFRQISLYLKGEIENNAKYISKKLMRDSRYFNKIARKTELKRKEIIQFLKKIAKDDLSRQNFSDLMKLTQNIYRLWIDYDVLTVQAWFVAGDEYKEQLRKRLNLPEKDFIFLTDPLEKTHASKLEDALVKSVIVARGYVDKLKHLAQKLSRDFGWIPFGYDGPEYWDKDYFILKLQEGLGLKEEALKTKLQEIKKRDRQIKNKYKSLIKKHQLTKEEQRLINIMQMMTIWTDERKALDYRLNYYYAQILHELEKRYDIPYLNLKYLFTDELTEVRKNREAVLAKTNYRINNDFIVEYKNGTYCIVSEKKRDKILKELEEQMKDASELKGMVACHGEKFSYQGKVKVLSSAKDGHKIEEGDFLVTNMTTPDYILSMRKSAGFITDEGGVTCHAAIVAREMNKPCIIGTRNATKVLKDGDEIEMDMATGIIKKLN